MDNKEKIVIVVAGGKGERMGANIPKQFIIVHGKPILMHTLEAFLRYEPSIKLIVVLPVTHIETWRALCQQYTFTALHTIVAGGDTRFQSVKNAIHIINTPSLVAVHDGVRPLVSIETIARCFDEAKIHGTAVPVVDLTDSLRKITHKHKSKPLMREDYRLVQTPQVFDSEILKLAYTQEFSALFMDDASVVETLGIKVRLVNGNRENIKITTPFDLLIAETFLAKIRLQKRNT